MSSTNPRPGSLRCRFSPPFLAEMPSDEARNEADALLCTDLWPDQEGADSTAAFVRSVCQLPEAREFLRGFVPVTAHRNPRLGFIEPSHPSAQQAEEGAAEVNGQRWTVYACALTGERFRLPESAPVPALLTDRGEHPATFTSAEVIHPALLEAGPAFVLWAVWSHIARLAWVAGQYLVAAAELLPLALSTEPADVGVPRLPIVDWREA